MKRWQFQRHEIPSKSGLDSFLNISKFSRGPDGIWPSMVNGVTTFAARIQRNQVHMHACTSSKQAGPKYRGGEGTTAHGQVDVHGMCRTK